MQILTSKSKSTTRNITWKKFSIGQMFKNITYTKYFLLLDTQKRFYCYQREVFYRYGVLISFTIRKNSFTATNVVIWPVEVKICHKYILTILHFLTFPYTHIRTLTHLHIQTQMFINTHIYNCTYYDTYILS